MPAPAYFSSQLTTGSMGHNSGETRWKNSETALAARGSPATHSAVQGRELISAEFRELLGMPVDTGTAQAGHNQREQADGLRVPRCWLALTRARGSHRGRLGEARLLSKAMAQRIAEDGLTHFAEEKRDGAHTPSLV